MGLKEYDKALSDITTAVKMTPTDASNFTWFDQSLLWASPPDVQQKFFDLVTEASSLAPVNYVVRAMYDLHRQDWEEATADVDRYVQAAPDDTQAYYYRALLLASAGATEKYRRACDDLLRRFGQTTDPEQAYWTAWTCSLAPDSVSDFDGVIRVAEVAHESADPAWCKRGTLGVALYRAGRFDESVALLDTYAQSSESMGLISKDSPAYAWFFLAMAHHRLGHRLQAAECLQKANTRRSEELSGGAAWNRQLTLKLLQDEAEKLLQDDSSEITTGDSAPADARSDAYQSPQPEPNETTSEL
jgi:tetratricopeptide (TPR) repeat protein